METANSAYLLTIWTTRYVSTAVQVAHRTTNTPTLALAAMVVNSVSLPHPPHRLAQNVPPTHIFKMANV